MQPLTAPPRDGLTAAAVTVLIRDTPGLHVSAGCELIDLGLNVVADISDRLAGGAVARESYATLHGSAQLSIEDTLDWGTAIVRPYLVLASPQTTARFNLGAYFTSTPKTELGAEPVLYRAECYDILDLLADPVGGAYAVPAGAAYLSTVEAILRERGYQRFVIDQSAAAKVLPSAKTWAMDENITWLTVVNELLGSVAYRGVWSDWDGRLRLEPYLSPGSQSSEWTYDVTLETSMLADPRTVTRDFYRAPNRWVFYRSNGIDGPAPVEGDGVYTYTNQSAGPTSVDARGGRVTTKPVPLAVADHASLVAAAQITIDADLRLSTKLDIRTAPNPLHWHFDRLTVDDPAIGPPAAALCTKWTLPLDGSDMSQDWTLL